MGYEAWFERFAINVQEFGNRRVWKDYSLFLPTIGKENFNGCLGG